MANSAHRLIEEALTAFSQNLQARKDALRIKDDTELWRSMKANRKGAISQKTVNNASKGRHDAKLSTLEAIAESVQVPLWIMFIPGLDKRFMETQSKDRLVKLVTDYLASDGAGRGQIENAAALYADLAKTRDIP
jgi:hypothetical protein